MVQLYFTCEHGGNLIPLEFKENLTIEKEILDSHKGWDIGILTIAKKITEEFSIPFTYSETTRLLVELNRSLDSSSLFSTYTQNFSKEQKKEVLENYYFPYRSKVECDIGEYVDKNEKVIHISFHSFTPVWNGKIREGDIGLLFDPSRTFERAICEEWLKTLIETSELHVLYNFPYLGTDDGLTTYLRGIFQNEYYAGIEIEINQKHLEDDIKRNQMLQLIKSSIKTLINQFNNA